MRVLLRGGPSARSPDSRRLQPAVLPPQTFPATWARIRQALASGGVFAGQLFGIRDSWADDPSMTFHARHEVVGLLDGLQILRLEETEQDGQASSGPKHWHTFDILARNHLPVHHPLASKTYPIP